MKGEVSKRAGAQRGDSMEERIFQMEKLECICRLMAGSQQKGENYWGVVHEGWAGWTSEEEVHSFL